MVIAYIGGLKTPVMTTCEPPSRASIQASKGSFCKGGEAPGAATDTRPLELHAAEAPVVGEKRTKTG